jgi:hypothetical protein
VEVAVLGGAAGLGLLVAWALSTRSHLRRRTPRDAEWDGTEQRPDLWTSAAPCPDCGARGGLLAEQDGAVWFTCLACGQRHRRDHRA